MALNERKAKSNQKYRDKFDYIVTRVPPEEKDRISEHAKKMGESLNAFVRRAMAETMDRDNLEFEKDDSQ